MLCTRAWRVPLYAIRGAVLRTGWAGRGAHCYAGNAVLALLRETRYTWERRVPLCPLHVKELVGKGFQVLVQPCTKRVYRDEDYEKAGAKIVEDVSAASLILGVKQVPEEMLIPDKNYAFFSHVIKAQPANMPLLDKLLQKNIRLFDYECLTEGAERGGQRLVAFGKYAGIAGMIDILQGLGQRLLAGGINTPFLNVSQSFTHESLEHAKRCVRRAGERLATEPLPRPLIFAFTGGGNVAAGARHIFELLPHEYISIEGLPDIYQKIKAGKTVGNMLYGVVVHAKDMVRPRDGLLFDRNKYYADPDNHDSVFHQNIAPYTNVIVNGMYWEPRFPRILTKSQLRALRRSGNRELLAVADITCDVEGSIEFLTHSTDIEKPFFAYVPETDESVDYITDDSVLMLGVDILPSELPREASMHFGNTLLPLIPALLTGPAANSTSDASVLPPEWYRACITSHGRLMPMYSYIATLRTHQERSKSDSVARQLRLLLRGHLFDTGLINRALDVIEAANIPFSIQNWRVRPNIKGSLPTPSSIEIVLDDYEGPSHDPAKPSRVDALVDALRDMTLNHPLADAVLQVQEIESTSASAPHATRRVLLLGSGMVAAPTVELLAALDDVAITIASDVQGEGQRLAALSKQGTFEQFRFPGVEGELDKLISRHDLVVSLLPASMHVGVARACIRHQRHLVTASYVSPEMQSLHDAAVASGITIMNEVGLDPGIDHMMIMKTLDDVRSRGGKILSLMSVCGGLPDIAAANNPFLYKFSWSPRGVLTATQNNAKYLKDGIIVEVPGGELLRSAESFDKIPGLSLEMYANRDSLVYGKVYGVEDAQTILRGTLRFKGWCNNMFALKSLGLLSTAPLLDADNLKTWSQLLQRHGSLPLDLKGNIDNSALVTALSSKGVKDAKRAVQALRWLDVLGEREINRKQQDSPMDILCTRLMEALKFDAHERDLVVMYHSVTAEFGDGKMEEHNSWLLMTGNERHSAMAATVGYTCGAAAELLLSGQVEQKGVLVPIVKGIYFPILQRLAGLGITFGESISK